MGGATHLADFLKYVPQRLGIWVISVSSGHLPPVPPLPTPEKAYIHTTSGFEGIIAANVIRNCVTCTCRSSTEHWKFEVWHVQFQLSPLLKKCEQNYNVEKGNENTGKVLMTAWSGGKTSSTTRGLHVPSCYGTRAHTYHGGRTDGHH